MKFNHIVFDWDGTLADTYPVISKAYEYTFSQLNLPPLSYEEIKHLTSTLQNKDLLGYIFGSQKEIAKKYYYDYIEKNHIKYIKAMPYAEELLKFCQTNNIQTYLISSKKRTYLLKEVSYLGFSSFFKNIVASGDSSEDKPSPSAAYAVFNNNLPSADSILVIGDGEADYKVARAYDRNNKKSCCIICDSTQHYKGPTPDFKVSTLKEIINLLTTEI